jgi:hypothetical protein
VNQQWVVSEGFIHAKDRPDLVIDGDGTQDGARVVINSRKAVISNSQRWIFEEVHYTWLTLERTLNLGAEDVDIGIPFCFVDGFPSERATTHSPFPSS